MISSRFRLLGVLVVGVGLMAFLASAAQAEGEWLVLETGKLLTGVQIEANKEKFEVGEVENNAISILAEEGTTKNDVLCTGFELLDGLLNATGGLKTGARAKFTGCKLLAEGAQGLSKEFSKCTPKTSGGPLGTVETLAFHGALKLHELAGGAKDDTLLLLPDNAEGLFASFELGAACAFGEELPFFGNLSLQDCGGNTKELEHLLSHLWTEFAPLTTLALFAPRGKTGSKNASVDGSVLSKLSSDRLYAGSPN